MTSELNTRPVARPGTLPRRPPARSAMGNPSPGHQVPSVPITVYRELATELQMTHAQLDSLSQQNRHLAEQNRQLRQEITRIVQSALQLQHLLDSFQPGNFSVPEAFEPEPSPPSVPQPPADRPHSPTPPLNVPEMMGMAPPTPRFTEQPDPSRQVRSRPERSRDLGGLWLTVMILIIIVTAFSAGFFIMRPFLNADQ